MATVKTFQVKSGLRYSVDWYGLNGVRRRKNFKDKKVAERFAKEIEVKKMRINEGLEVSLESNLPLPEMVKEYKKYMANQKDPETIRRETSIYNALEVFLGNIKIRAINKVQLTHYLEYRQVECDISPATAATEHRTLKAFFNTLVRYNYLQENPILAVQAPRNLPKEIIILTDDEVKEFLSKVDSSDYRDLFLMYLHTGARRGEILPGRPFTWDNVNFKRREITLIGKKRVPRIVPLDDVAFELLHRRKFDEHREFPFNFNYDYLYKKYLRYLKAAKIKATGLHTLRRTYGSRLVESGVDVFDVSKMLGHQDVKITIQHYIHVNNEKLHRAASKLNDVW
jgi:integrase